MRECEQEVKKATDLLTEVEALEEEHDANKDGYGTSANRNEEVDKLIAVAKEHAEQAIQDAKDTWEAFKSQWQTLRFNEKVPGGGGKKP